MLISFECPEEVLKHPDVKVERNGDTVARAIIVGCKTCQQTKSECRCDIPVSSEKIVWDGFQAHDGLKQGELGYVYYLFFAERKSTMTSTPRRTRAPLKSEELAPLAPDLGFLAEGDGSGTMQPENEFCEDINPDLLSWLIRPEASLCIYFTYPKSKEAEVRALFDKKGRVLHIAPLKDPGPDTKTARGECAPRGGPGATILFRTPKDISCLDQFKHLLKDWNADKPMVTFRDYKLALKLFFDHGFEMDGPRWLPGQHLEQAGQSTPQTVLTT